MQDKNIEREKVPKMNKNTRKRVEELYYPRDGQKGLNATEIWDQLDYENAEKGEQYILVSVRSIQRFIQKLKARESESLKLERQPWNMVFNEKAGIPFDPILLRLLRLWFSRYLERGQGIPFVAFPIGIAKWAVRLHMVAPSLSEKELLYRARQYFNMERMDILTGREPDSIRDDLEIAIEDPDTAPKVKADYDQFYGVKKLVPQDKEVQTENGKVFQIEVAPDIVAKKIMTKKKTEPEIREELKHYGFDNTTIETVLARIKKRGLVNMRKNKQQKRRTET